MFLVIILHYFVSISTLNIESTAPPSTSTTTTTNTTMSRFYLINRQTCYRQGESEIMGDKTGHMEFDT